ncbi:MAG TPA: AMP-binding protein [Thermosynechococcaceae cyanobacterium]
MNIATLLQQQATLRPQAPALIDSWGKFDRLITFAELELAVGQAATLLRRSGLQAGDRVLVFHPMAAELYIILGAAFRLGLVAMFLDPGAGRAHLERSCVQCPPQALIATSKAYALLGRVSALRRIPLKFAIGLPLPGTLHWQQLHSLSPEPTIAACPDTAPALLTFTSGSTGMPKAALRTHGFLLAQYRVLLESLRLTPDTTELTTLPIFVLANLAVGATTLIPRGNLRAPGTIAPAPVLKQIQTYSPDRILASPAFLERLVNYARRHQMALSSVRHILSGGAPILPRLLQQLPQFAPQAEITILYGSTEAEPIAQIRLAQMQAIDLEAMQSGKGLLVGVPIPAIQLRIVPPDRAIFTATPDQFAAICLPKGAVGEIVVSGDHVLSSYWQGQGDRDTKFRVGEAIWHRTGDAGYVDSADRLWLLGRCEACIHDGNGDLYPFQIEGWLQRYPEICRSAVIFHQGQRVLLIEPCRSAPPLDLEAIKKSLEWASLGSVRVCAKLPVDRRHNGKIVYSELLKLLRN